MIEAQDVKEERKESFKTATVGLNEGRCVSVSH
jgi:hypothetical protein